MSRSNQVEPEPQLLVRPYRHMIGLARYESSLRHAFDQIGFRYRLARTAQPRPLKALHRLLAPFRLDLCTFFTTYPLAADLEDSRLTHLTAQQMGLLLWFRRQLHPCVVTVHDIVPYLVRDDDGQSTFRHPLDKLFDAAAMRGLKRADCLVTDSEFTKLTVVNNLAYPEERIHVIPLGVAHEIFRPMLISQAFYDRYKLDPQLRYILYVGSENPRKNLVRLVQAFAVLRSRIHDVRLVKIGSVEYQPQAARLNEEIEKLGLKSSVLFIDHVSDAELALFYNAADLFVFPSLYEGFGLPPLEAMACGTPVVSSNAASLPEVVGDAAIQVNPHSVDEIAGPICRVLEDKELAQDLRARGLERANQFSWERTARETINVYEKVLDS